MNLFICFRLTQNAQMINMSILGVLEPTQFCVWDIPGLDLLFLVSPVLIGSSYFKGERMIKYEYELGENDPAVMPIYDVNGYIAGISTAVSCLTV